MAIHRSSVNYQNLIRDLAEMYPFEIADVIVVELVANALDAKATRISIDYHPQNKILTVTDDGEGMTMSQFDEYHDFAAGLKARGTGIGFAGIGAKISFNIAGRVITETRSRSFLGGSNWYLQSDKKLIWEDVQPTHIRGCGTRVEVRFRSDAKLSYSSAEDLVKLLRRHYLPLLDDKFLGLYERLGYYSRNLRFIANGQIINTVDLKKYFTLDKIREFFPARLGKKIGYGIFGLSISEYPVGVDACGVLLCTHGKVIKADFFNQFPGSFGSKIFGLVEIPNFVEFLTTNKTDFLRKRGKQYRKFEGLYNPVRQEFKAWLAKLGVQQMEARDTDEARKLERELKKLVDDIPELAEFFGFRARKAVLQQSPAGKITAELHEGTEATFPFGNGLSGKGLGPLDVGEQPGEALVENDKGGTKPAKAISRTARRGPKISFTPRPDRVDLAWIDGSSVVINSAHPSYTKARSNSLARRLHSLFAIANAVQKFMESTESAQDQAFMDRMMAAWGRK